MVAIVVAARAALTRSAGVGRGRGLAGEHRWITAKALMVVVGTEDNRKLPATCARAKLAAAATPASCLARERGRRGLGFMWKGEGVEEKLSMGLGRARMAGSKLAAAGTWHGRRSGMGAAWQVRPGQEMGALAYGVAGAHRWDRYDTEDCLTGARQTVGWRCRGAR